MFDKKTGSTPQDIEIILASASPRRRELLGNIGLSFRVVPSEVEECIDPGMSPEQAVCALSLEKAREVAGRVCGGGRKTLIIAADTVVSIGGEILGKPASDSEAAEMLRKLSGREHTVFTGVTLLMGGAEITAFESTAVRFREMTGEEIAAYIATDEPMDKAGAYGVQGFGALFVEGITGDFFNVMGLPLCQLYKMLESLGVRFF